MTDGGPRAHHLARVGYVALGLVYLMIAWLAVQLALGNREGTPSSTGALREFAQQPLGDVLVWAVSIGLILLAGWQAVTAATGGGDKGPGERAMAGGKAAVYLAGGWSGVKLAAGSGTSGKAEERWSARLLDLPGGQLLVGAVAIAIIGYGLWGIRRAWTEEYADALTREGRDGATGTAYLWFGKVGYAARGLAFVVVGALFATAAVQHDAQKSGGMDQALFEILDLPLGPVLLCAIGAGLGCYGLFNLARARHLSVE